MVRFPEETVDGIDVFVGHTHTSRPDFVIDAVRQYLFHITGCESRIIENLRIAEEEDEDLLQQVKETYYLRRMNVLTRDESNQYYAVKENSNSMRDVNVLLNMPQGLYDAIVEIVGRTMVFGNHQEFIKVAVYFLFSRMMELGSRTEDANAFTSGFDGVDDLEEAVRKLEDRFSGGSR